MSVSSSLVQFNGQRLTVRAHKVDKEDGTIWLNVEDYLHALISLLSELVSVLTRTAAERR